MNPHPGALAVDCTLGGGGHTHALLERIRPGGRLLGLDLDPDAIERVRSRFSSHPEATFRQGSFRDLYEHAKAVSMEAVDAIIFDLGFSSFQVDDPSRGFSFRRSGPLDMRLSASGPSAADLVNQRTAEELARIIKEYGEERWAKRIAQFIVSRRPLHTTEDLSQAVQAAIPKAAWPRDVHPATRTFQALRIAVNDELGSLREGLAQAASLLRPGGRMAVISFHSLEDREVKTFFARESRDCLCPPEQPVCTCGHRRSLRTLTRKPILPSNTEVAGNPRARSARMRGAEKL